MCRLATRVIYSGVNNAGFVIVERALLIKLFNTPVGKAACRRSDIVDDFARHLENIEIAVQSFEALELGEWGKYARMGFLAAVQRKSGDGRWHYVSNRGGIGVYAVSLFESKAEVDCDLYLIEAKDGRLDLCFKLRANAESFRRFARAKWSGALDGRSRKYSNASNAVQRPDRKRDDPGLLG